MRKVPTNVVAAPQMPSSKMTPLADPSSAIYANADDNVSKFVENLYNEYKIRASIEKVIDYIEEKLKKRANRVIAYVSFSKKLLKDKSYKHCNNLLSEGIQRHHDSAPILMEMGKLKYVTQIFPEAAESFSAALTLKDVNRNETLYNLALSCIQMGNPLEAVTHLQTLLASSPDSVGALSTLGVAYKRLGKREDALKMFHQAVKIMPNDYESLNNIGTIFYEQEQYEKAAEQYLKALQIKVDDVEILSNLGNALLKIKDFNHACVAFDEALKISPSNTQIIENYLLSLLEMKRIEQFDEMLKKIKFLSAEVKNRMNKIGDEYKNTLGVGMGSKFVRKPSIRDSSIVHRGFGKSKSGVEQMLASSIKRVPVSSGKGHLQIVEEEKE